MTLGVGSGHTEHVAAKLIPYVLLVPAQPFSIARMMHHYIGHVHTKARG